MAPGLLCHIPADTSAAGPRGGQQRTNEEHEAMSNNEPAGMIDDLERGYDGDAWHGPSLRKVLADVTALTASARPIPNGHTIWEIVAHLTAWDDVVSSRIAERRSIEVPGSDDFPAVTTTGAVAWSDALSKLGRQHTRLIETVSKLDEAKLQETVAGKGYSVEHMLRGVVQHMAYHAGQIALMKKLADAPQARPASPDDLSVVKIID
jgi:uncharacterized damage-inducible protein DinB